jgi:hypothetical protein
LRLRGSDRRSCPPCCQDPKALKVNEDNTVKEADRGNKTE